MRELDWRIQRLEANQMPAKSIDLNLANNRSRNIGCAESEIAK
jgi:hypothetical protein